MSITAEQLDARAQPLRLLLFDVDGVLTEGTVTIDGNGGESKTFSIRDGAAIVWAQRAGLEVGLLSGRASDATSRRAAELGIQIVLQGESNKRAAYERLLADKGWRDDEVAYMGDDLIDLPVLARVGLSAAPADACADVQQRVHHVTQATAGHGAVREFIERVLRGRGLWDAVLASHVNP
jgi:3-deoxy-D-manno-octulosonate 8-phosphate phosphatase (KDO 8-P phosphatase)